LRRGGHPGNASRAGGASGFPFAPGEAFWDAPLPVWRPAPKAGRCTVLARNGGASPLIRALWVGPAEGEPTPPRPAGPAVTGTWELELPRTVASLHVLVQGSCRLELDTPVWTWGLDRRTLLLARPGIVGRLRLGRPDPEERAELVSTELSLGGEDRMGLLGVLPPGLRIDGNQIPGAPGVSTTGGALGGEVHAPPHGAGFVRRAVCVARS